MALLASTSAPHLGAVPLGNRQRQSCSDFDALRPVLITDSTSEIADDPEKPCQVKFTWRYAENRINLQNPKSSGVFTDDYDFVFA